MGTLRAALCRVCCAEIELPSPCLGEKYPLRIPFQVAIEKERYSIISQKWDSKGSLTLWREFEGRALMIDSLEQKAAAED